MFEGQLEDRFEVGRQKEAGVSVHRRCAETHFAHETVKARLEMFWLYKSQERCRYAPTLL